MGISALSYQNSIDAHFNIWCSHFAKEYAMPLGEMVRDDYLQNWYRDQWTHKVELAFYTDNRDYLDAGLKDEGNMQDLFLQYAEVLLDVFPKSLFDELKRRTKHEILSPNNEQ